MTRDLPTSPLFVAGLSALAPNYDLVLCDIWGVLHDGLSAFPDAGAALTRFREGGGRVILVSNAPRPAGSVAEQLDGFGVPRSAYDAVVTSGDVTRDLIRAEGGRPLFHLGPARDLALFDDLSSERVPFDEATFVVCTGLLDDERETLDDYAGTLGAMRERNMLLICANPDIVVERGERLIPCAGALAAAYDAMGGRTVTGGKPHRPIYDAAFALGAELLGHAPEPGRVLAIGDAIRTDIAGARDFGTDALLVARGIHAADLGYGAGRPLDEAHGARWLVDQSHQPTAVTSALLW